MEATEIVGAGEKVLVGIFQRGRLLDSETSVEGRWWQVVTFRDGLIIRSELFPERYQALEAAELSEYARQSGLGHSPLRWATDGQHTIHNQPQLAACASGV